MHSPPPPPTLSAEHAGRYGQRAGGTHPTGNQSCVEFLLFSCKRLCAVAFRICSQFFERPFPIFMSKAGYRTAYLQNWWEKTMVLWWVVLRRDRDRDILARLRFGHQRPVNRRCPDEKYQYVNNNRLTEYPGTPAWTPADTRDLLVTGVQAGLDTCDLVVAGVRISISPKYLYLYLELSGSTVLCITAVSDR